MKIRYYLIMRDLYIHRELVVGEQSYNEEQLLREGSLFVVLAEPGAGKTQLLAQLGQLLTVTPIRASIFRNKKLESPLQALVIDAMDEVARLDRLSVEDIILKAREIGAGTVVFAGRSSEWDAAETQHVKRYFGVEPIVVQLKAFTQSEQQQLFFANFPKESFDSFAAECARFELHSLLGNPQFLLLFGEAYIQSGRHFVSKKAIYRDAVLRLAREVNPNLLRSTRLPEKQIVKMACEVFAKLMLSGSTGVSASERDLSCEYPYLRSLVADTPQDAHYLADTRLLKPSHNVGLHEPTHRIIAEYCAASYLVSRIDDPADRLSLARMLAIIAPKGTVRTELRGMLGWMAALAQGSTQRQLIELDPYAVIANGDPSEFTTSSKKTLLQTLSALADTNPLFRRSDAWRQFNVGTFFSSDIRDDVAALLSPAPADSPLRDLILELLSSSDAAGQFASELHTIGLDNTSYRGVRKAAYSLLLKDAQFDPRPDVPALLLEKSRVSLELAAMAVRSLGSEKFEPSHVIELLRSLSELYPKQNDPFDRSMGSRYFIRGMVESLDQQVTTRSLSQLTTALSCNCNPKYESQCTCRIGISKIIGLLLDHHLPNVSDLDPEQVWGWTRALVFQNQRSSDDSPAVKVLSENQDLRQAIQRLAVSGLVGEQAREAVRRFFHSSVHSGIRFSKTDLSSLAEYAYQHELVDVWSALWVPHNTYDEKIRENPLRTLMRAQANDDARFMQVWAKRDRLAKRNDEERRFRFRSRQKRLERRDAEIIEHNRTHLIANRAQIESGEHWGWLEEFANQYLFEPEKFTNPDYGDTPLRALLNCIPFLRPHVPNLEELSQRKGTNIAVVLFAHCLVRFRTGESLGELDPAILRAAITELASYPAIDTDDELDAIEAELNRLVFSEPGSVREFACTYIEPLLSSMHDTPTNVELLEHKKIFQSLRETLPLEWLQRYPEMPISAQRRLFEMAARRADRKQLEALIDKGFDKSLPIPDVNAPEQQTADDRHRFWALNAFFFSTVRRDQALAELRQDPKSILAIAELVGRYGWNDSNHIPPLSAEAVFDILDAFVGAWPKVDLPDTFGTGDPDNETAYRFLRDIVWRIGADIPARKLPVLNRLLEDERFEDDWPILLNLRADAIRDAALADFRPPSPESISDLLDRNAVASVEDLRALMVEVLNNVQVDLKGLDTDPLDTFYDGGKHVNENTARNRVVDMIRARLTALGIPVVIEHHMAGGNRSDFTASASVSGANPLLVVEAKGQWHAELFNAASAQLNERYSIHPNASGQGIYLVFWFGNGVTVAGREDLTITSAYDLREAILKRMPEDLKKSIDVVVLDLFRLPPTPKHAKPRVVRSSPLKSSAK